jgi:nucleotide-binding universal stress UspA family protein
MTTQIHCAVDDSEGARRALAHAAELAEVMGGSLALVHAVPDGPHAARDRASVERERLAGWQAAQLLFADLRDELALASGTLGTVVHGPAGQLLVDLSEEDDLELLVVGSRGRGGLRRAVLGSVSARVASRAACPVMVVPAAAGVPGTGRGIVCGVDDPSADGAVLRLAGEMAQLLAEPLRVVHADPSLTAMSLVGHAPPNSIFSPAALPPTEFARDLVLQGFRGELSVSVMPPALALEAVGRAENARMIVVGSGRRRRVGGAARSTSMQLAANADRPVLVLPHTAGEIPLLDEDREVTGGHAA